MDSITVEIMGMTPAVSVTMSCCVAAMATILPYRLNSGVIAAVTVSAGRRLIGNETVTSSNLPRLPKSSRLTLGAKPSGIPSSRLITISIRSRRISV